MAFAKEGTNPQKKKGFPIKKLAVKKSGGKMHTSSCKGKYKLHQEDYSD